MIFFCFCVARGKDFWLPTSWWIFENHKVWRFNTLIDLVVWIPSLKLETPLVAFLGTFTVWLGSFFAAACSVLGPKCKNLKGWWTTVMNPMTTLWFWGFWGSLAPHLVGKYIIPVSQSLPQYHRVWLGSWNHPKLFQKPGIPPPWHRVSVALPLRFGGFWSYWNYGTNVHQKMNGTESQRTPK